MLYLFYVCDISEDTIGLLPPGNLYCFQVFQQLRQSLVQMKNWIPTERKNGVVYEIPLQMCVYQGTGLGKSDGV